MPALRTGGPVPDPSAQTIHVCGTGQLDEHSTAEVCEDEEVGQAAAPSCCRVCVDTASMMVPGEGLLVGSFARALFLVHSECAESLYINSRPFRVNAGAVSTILIMQLCTWHACTV